jgi:phenylacetate-CoA ligase
VTQEQTLVITNMDSLPQPPSPHAKATPQAGHVDTFGTELRGPPPLLRYHIHDRGGIMSYAALSEFVRSRGYSVPLDVAAAQVERRLPFAWVFGREHWAVSLYGANVFVDQVMVALELSSVADAVTGKFILDIETDEDANPRLCLDVECAPSQSPTNHSEGLISQIQQGVLEELLRVNSEYANYVPAHSQTPVVKLHPHGTPSHFPVGVKHKWTR